jgi:four helix bundle protein
MQSAAKAPIRSYKDLIVWQRSMDLLEAVHLAIRSLPDIEKYALADQLRRSVLSIPSNISEGHGRLGKREFLHFLSNSRGSLCEVQTQIHVAERLHYWPRVKARELLDLADEVGRLLNALISALRARKKTATDSQPQPPAPSH